MLGLLLNTFNKADVAIREMATIGRFVKNPFGRGKYSAKIDISSKVSISELRTNGSYYAVTSQGVTVADDVFKDLEFNNLTIDGLLYTERFPRTQNNTAGKLKNQPQTINYIPAFIKVKNTLTISGRISADGAGCVPVTHYGTRTIREKEWDSDNGRYVYKDVTYATVIPESVPYFAPMDFSTSVENYGHSVNTTSYLKLFWALCSSSIQTLATSLFGGSGMSFSTEYKETTPQMHPDYIKKLDPNDPTQKYLTNNAICINNGGLQGGAGGFIFLTFKHLYYTDETGKRIEYGKDSNFPVNKIRANGVLTNKTSKYLGEGGGTLFIYANIINIVDAGIITADGTSYENGTLIEQNRAYLNNLPELGYNQTGLYANGSDYVFGKPEANSKYYYSDGSTESICTHSAEREQDRTIKCGGAGIVIGVKVS